MATNDDATNKHTPGPWFWRGTELRTRAALGRNHSFAGWIVPISDADIQLIFRYGAAKANRALIAAAPDLLAALEDLVARCDGAEGVRADGSNIQTMAAHAALAIARGES